MDATAPQQLTRGQEVMKAHNYGSPETIQQIRDLFSRVFDEIDNQVKLKTAPDLEPGVYNARHSDIFRLAAIAKTNLETACLYAIKAVTR